ncbi:hypothetical protein PAGU2196_24410 [Pseudomonas sp. PAGU 2196]|nr:hypothetical protein PAGU2196_24410 [Pseudomonas sp. PAGU 2196]
MVNGSVVDHNVDATKLLTHLLDHFTDRRGDAKISLDCNGTLVGRQLKLLQEALSRFQVDINGRNVHSIFG